MPQRCVLFFDGQNLYRRAKELWAPPGIVEGGSPYFQPNCDVVAMADSLVARSPGRVLVETRFYTGVPSAGQDAPWNQWWANKIRALTRADVYVFRGRLTGNGPDFNEKGVDVSIAVDLVRYAYEQRYDVAIIVSEDSDLLPAVEAAKKIGQDQGRILSFESAFPYDEARFRDLRRKPIGIGNSLIPVKISKEWYDACLDHTDYRT